MKPKFHYLITALIVVGFAANVWADKDRDELAAGVKEAKAKALKEDPGLSTHFDKAAGYVIFPSVGKAGLGVGGALGNGQLFEKDKLMGQAHLSQLSIGFQAGGQAYSEFIFFEDQTALDSFKKGNFEFSAQVSAVALKSGVSANAKYEHGVMVLTMAKGGLMYEASVGGQKFKYEPYKD